MTQSHHNLILANLACCPNDQILSSLQVIEALRTTSVINKHAQTLGFITDLSTVRSSNIFYEHVLSNAQDIHDAHTLEDINGQFENPANRFQGAILSIIEDPNHPRDWGHGNLYFEFDIIQSALDVKANILRDKSTLSSNNLICIRPVAPDGEDAIFLFSDLMSNILPRIKIFPRSKFYRWTNINSNRQCSL